MSDRERAECRAEGALDNFLAEMRKEMIDKERSSLYIEIFWNALNNRMQEGLYYE